MRKFTLILMFLLGVAMANAATPILGTNVATVERMYQFVKSNNSSFDREIAEQFIAVSERYGLRGDIALCQSIIETGWFKYTGGTAVTADDHNYCGLGVTTLGQKGCQFETVKEGVTAQVQHLYAYACNKSLPAGETLVDPRYNYVTRGCAPNWEDLGSGKWASAAGYGTAIIAMYNDMMAFQVAGDDTPSTPTPSLTASTTSVSLTGTQGGTAPSATVTITGANLTSTISYNSSSSAFKVTASNWNSATGGTLTITLNTSLSAGSYSGYIAVKSGTTSVKINCVGTISAASTPTPGTPSLTASTTSISFTAQQGATAPSQAVTITGVNLPSQIYYNSSTSAFKVTASNWDDLTGGTLTISLDTSKEPGTYSGYVAVQSGSNSSMKRVEINCIGTITSASGSETPETPIVTIPTVFTTDWSYSATNGTSISWMNPSNDYTRNMVLNNDKLYVVQRDPDNAIGYIRIVNANTGVVTGNLPSTGIANDAYQFVSVANMGGTIVACNLAYGATSTLRVYSWNSDTSTPSIVLETTNHGGRSGDLMSASGTINNGKLYFSSNTGYEGKVYVYTVTNGVASPTPQVITLKDASGATYNLGGQFAVIEIRANEDGTFWATGKNGAPALFNANGTLIRELNDTSLDGNIYGSSYCPITFGEYKLAAAVTYKTEVQQGYLNLINVSDGEASATKLNSYPVLGASGVSNGTFVTTALAKVDGTKIHLWTLIPKQGVAKYTAQCELVGIEAIEADEESASIAVYDNKIAVMGAETETIAVYSLTGVKVAEGNGNELATDNLVHGIYVVVAVTPTGNVITDKVYID